LQFGPYSVIRQIGRGGMGTVYEVRHPEIPRSLALKVVRSDVLDEVTRQRFRREGEALAAIKHPNVVSVHQLETFGEHLVLVTELVEGVSLHERLRQQGPLAPESARQVLAGIAGAVTQLHERGLIHRDLKPDNVLIRQDGTPVVIDFGLARDTQVGSNLTRTGEILGTPSFMAPEQARDASRADARSDVYALGAILFACLAGHPPFRGATALDTLDRVLHAPPEWPKSASDWPGPLRQLCRKALSKEPAERPSSAGEFLSALEERGSPRRKTWLVGGAALLMLAAAVGFSLLPNRTGRESQLVAEDAIRLGEAPLPTSSLGPEASPELQCWSGIHELLRGGPPRAELVALSEGATPGAHGLGAALAAIRGDLVEVERRLEQHGQVRRVELRLLPSLARAHQGAVSRRDARQALRLFDKDSELSGLVEFRGLRALARRGSSKEPLEPGALEDTGVPVWAREVLLTSAIREPLDAPTLDLIGSAGDWLTPRTRAQLVERIGGVIRQLAPREDQERFSPERLRLLTHAIDAFRGLAPYPAEVPEAEALVKFMLSSGVDLIAGDSAGQTEEDFDYALTLADAFPDNALVQSAAGQSVWSARLANPRRWKRLLVIARRELALLHKEEASLTLGPQRQKYRAQTRQRMLRILTGLQEALPPGERDLEALQSAREISLVLRDTDPTYPELSHAIDLLYVRFLEGTLSAEEVAKIPADWRTVRLDVIRFAFLSPRDQATKTRDLFNKTLAYAKREVTAGILMHRVIADYLWPKEGVRAKDPSRAIAVIGIAAKALQTRNPHLALHWWIQTTRLTLVGSRERAIRRCKTIASYARQAGLHDLAEEILAVARDPKDEKLKPLADRTLLPSLGR